MSGTRPTPAEQHLGDRLAALVDGELGHDARERVLAHLATCARCKAEADAQRRVKSVFAQAAPPPPSEGLLARLQGLPGGPAGRDDDDERRSGGGPGGRRPFADGVFEVTRDGFALPGGPGSGFPIHEVGRPAADRSPWRGRRFAFAAASAVSFAAIALGGALPTAATLDTRGEGGNNVTPLRTPGQTANATTNAASDRRRGGLPANGGGTATPSPFVRTQARQTGAPPFLPATLPATSLTGAVPPAPRAPRLHLATAPGLGTVATTAPSQGVVPLIVRR
ncbi:zf-HC2 domain-containing protein [Streptomyces sp. NPDC003036]|uniref:anti-sigma factor family protein n=1 Tax=Streptomyces sp. NPDC003036 TaxID=3154442 RepID=UPI0033AC0F64